MDHPINREDIQNLKIDLETLGVDAFLEKHNPPVDLSGKRWAYVIVVEQTDKEGNYIPCIAVENESGYYPMTGRGAHSAPWKWGKDYETACQIAEEMNAKMGLSEEEAYKIVVSSMFTKQRAFENDHPELFEYDEEEDWD